MYTKKLFSSKITKTILLYASMVGCCLSSTSNAKSFDKANDLPNISGLAQIDNNLFLGIHDVKPKNVTTTKSYISLLKLPAEGEKNYAYKAVTLKHQKFTKDYPAYSDLESATRIPGRENEFLLAESGQVGKPRILYATYTNENESNSLTINSTIPWPGKINNVEAIEVCRVKVNGKPQYLFLYAERAEGAKSVKLRWSHIDFDGKLFEFRGEFHEEKYIAVDPVGKKARPIVAMYVDDNNFIYIASAFDSGVDSGLYRSTVWKIGECTVNNNTATVNLFSKEMLKGKGEVKVATVDGIKIESLAGGTKENIIYFGADDENYGGMVRPLYVDPASWKPKNL